MHSPDFEAAALACDPPEPSLGSEPCPGLEDAADAEFPRSDVGECGTSVTALVELKAIEWGLGDIESMAAEDDRKTL